MLILCLLYFALGFWFVDSSQYRRYNEIDVKLVSENDETFQSKLQEMLEKSERSLIENKIVDGILNVAGSFSEKINRVGQVLLLIK